MTRNRKGSRKMSSGRWSNAVADYFDLLIRSKDLTRDKVANDTGISEGRLPQLLSGSKAWYLEDVDILCSYFNLDFIELLRGLEVDELPPISADKDSPPFELQAEAGAA